MRVLLGIPTKKGKPPWMSTWEGKICSNLTPGMFHYDPATPFAEAINEGRKSQIRILAHPQRPEMVCRTLLKMGIEVIAANKPANAIDEKFDAARRFALYGEKDCE